MGKVCFLASKLYGAFADFFWCAIVQVIFFGCGGAFDKFSCSLLSSARRLQAVEKFRLGMLAM